MTARLLVTRRMLLKDMGKAGLAMMVLGTAACSGETGGSTTPTGEAEPTSTSRVSATTVTSATASTTSSHPTGSGWHRVDLDFVAAYILYRGGEAVVVDTGVDGSAMAIGSALETIGLDWGDVGGLIVTHKHPDHQGSVRGVLAATPPDTPWYAGAGDIAEITAPHEGLVVGDGDRVDHLEIIETPGHTPGHLSVLDPLSGVLVAGDALNGEDGGVVGPNPGFSEDMTLANSSVVKLAGFDYEVALFGHGEPVLSGASQVVGALAEDL